MEAAAVNGGCGDGIFAAAVNANDGMVAAASTAAAQLTMTTAIPAATIGRTCHITETKKGGIKLN
jgi:hypothetical protein